MMPPSLLHGMPSLPDGTRRLLRQFAAPKQLRLRLLQVQAQADSSPAPRASAAGLLQMPLVDGL